MKSPVAHFLLLWQAFSMCAHSLWNISNNILLIENLKIATHFSERFFGLLGRASLPKDAALLLPRCKQIHMFFMKFPIDLVFCDQNGIVLHTVLSIKPWRISQFVMKADFVVEFADGFLEQGNVAIGDMLAIRANTSPSKEA